MDQQLQSKKDIEKISIDILKDSKSYGVFPTPIDKIITYSELIVAGGIDLKSLQEKHKSFFFSDAFKSGLSKIRGFLDRREKIIYVDTEQNINRQGFVKLHETGHNVLPWQKNVLEFLDDDSTLDPKTKEEFEAEANYFASGTLFQHDLFLDEIKKYELGIPATFQLAKYFGASTHATLRRYVEQSHKRCALLVLEKISPKGQPPAACFRNSFHSSKFVKEFGEITWPDQFGFTWSFIQDYYFNKRVKMDGVVSLETSNGRKEFHYHFFNNTFNAFVLFFPKGENKKTRTKIILKTSLE
jgi:Zn-dependent peptidase ImmA (M78 family)